MSVRLEGEPRILSLLGLSWWQRMRARIWLHFLPHRVFCAFAGHRWKPAQEVVDSGPLHLPPSARTYRLLAYKKWCSRCATNVAVPLSPATEAFFLGQAQARDWEEWNDPNVRRVLERLGGQSA